MTTAPRWPLALTAALPFVCAAAMPMVPAIAALGYPLSATVLPPAPAIAAFAAAFVVAALASAVGVALRWRRAGHDGALVAALIALVVTYAASALAGIEALDSLKQAFAAAIAGVAVLSCTEVAAVPALRRAWLTTFLAVGAAATGYAIVIALVPASVEGFVYAHGRAYGTFLQPNELAAFSLFLIPIAVAMWWGRRDPAEPHTPAARIIAIVAAPAGAIGLALSAARAAWLGAFVGMLLFARALGRRALAAVAGVFALVAVVAMLWNGARHDPSENALRVGVWGGAARVVERFALTGTGPGHFAQAYERVRLPSAETGVLHAHDLALNVLAENGIVGFAAVAWLVIAAIAAVRRARASMPDDPRRAALYAALVAGFAASALQSIAHVTMFVVLWAPMLGIMLGLCRRTAQETP